MVTAKGSHFVNSKYNIKTCFAYIRNLCVFCALIGRISRRCEAGESVYQAAGVSELRRAKQRLRTSFLDDLAVL